ncbi:MAG: valine--pyruvate transaminase [Leptospirales bacterium]|jgi:valine--pyruvate aminotransferase
MPSDSSSSAAAVGSDEPNDYALPALSRFGERFSVDSGILELMQDLDLALNSRSKKEYLMLGGGNPARIPAVERRIREAMRDLMADGDRFERMIGIYDHPQGGTEFRSAVAELLRAECGWRIDAANIALTNGSQSSFFQLFNLLGGEDRAGRLRRVLLPLIPEYIGYGETGIAPDLFEALPPLIERIDAAVPTKRAGDSRGERGSASQRARRTFKYHLDFESLEGRLRTAHSGGDVAALCVSRPTNPSGNVLNDADLRRLSDSAREAGVPLIIDCAYGLPFPGVDFTGSRPFWNSNTIVTLSLSKLGLPGVRTGIVVARPEIAAGLRRMNAVMNLASGGVGPALARDLVRSGEILRLSRDFIAPFYRAKSDAAVERFHELFADLEGCRVHANEGAFFLWLWFDGLPIGTDELYRRLKARGVLVVPGRYYFPGLAEAGPGGESVESRDLIQRHRHECIRVSCAQDEALVAEGLRRIAEEARAAYRSGG